VRDLRLFDIVLLGKWKWRLGSESQLYRVKYAYNELYNGSIGEDANLYNILWKLNVFPST